MSQNQTTPLKIRIRETRRRLNSAAILLQSQHCSTEDARTILRTVVPQTTEILMVIDDLLTHKSDAFLALHVHLKEIESLLQGDRKAVEIRN